MKLKEAWKKVLKYYAENPGRGITDIEGQSKKIIGGIVQMFEVNGMITYEKGSNEINTLYDVSNIRLTDKGKRVLAENS